MRQPFIAWAALVLAALSLALGIMNRPPKVGYVETSKLLADFSEAVQARKAFQEAKAEWEKNLNSANDSLVAYMESMQKGFDQADQAGKATYQREFERRNQDLKRYTQAVRVKAEEKEKELMEPVLRKMNGFLDEWGKKHGYALIMGTMTGGNILQADSRLNLTSRILMDLNSQYKELPVAPVSMADSAKSTAQKQ